MKKILIVLFAIMLFSVGCKKKSFDVTFNDPDGKEIVTTSYEKGMIPSYNYEVTDTAEWDYTFKGWSKTLGGSVILLPEVTEAVSYFAVVEKVKRQYTITFNTGKGSSIDPITKDYNTDVAAPQNPVLEGYTFDKWYKEADFKTEVTWPLKLVNNVTLYAKFVEEPEVKYNVTFKDETGKLLDTISVGENVIPTYSYDVVDTDEYDYTFKGWSKTLGGTLLTSLPKATADATYFAVVEKVKKQYTITFVTNGGSSVTSITKEYNTEVPIPTKPTKDEFSFAGWCLDSDLKEAVTWPYKLTKNVTFYAKWNVKIDISGYLKALLNGYKKSPYDYIPEAMRFTYENNLVNVNNLTTDYSNFVNVSSIIGSGFGEQWHMVTENLLQSQKFFNALTVVDGLATSSIAAFNNYLDKNPASTANHTFKDGIYSVTIDFDGTNISYVLDYTGNFPVFGEQTAQIALSMDITTNVKKVRIQMGNPNALTYEIDENSYKFGIKYLGVRRAYFALTKNTDNSVDGHIYEISTVSSVTLKNAADFYIGEEYTSVVGNKASGIPGFSGFISELYDTTTGKLLSYEVQETLEKITYNTLWFDLKYISGITSIKYLEKTDTVPAAFYVNGLSTAFESKTVGGLSLKMLSRRYDIEFRKQYFYSYDATTKEYTEITVSVPMLFVQEEFLDTLPKDLESKNDGVNVAITLSSTHLTKVMADYDDLIPKFVINKDLMTEEKIIAFIGEPIKFE